MSLAPESVLQRAPGAESSRLGGEWVVLDPAGRTLRGLNATGGRIWELLDGRRSLQQIAEALSAEQKAPLERVLGEVIAFVDALATRRLVLPVQGGGA